MSISYLGGEKGLFSQFECDDERRSFNFKQINFNTVTEFQIEMVRIMHGRKSSKVLQCYRWDQQMLILICLCAEQLT